MTLVQEPYWSEDHDTLESAGESRYYNNVGGHESFSQVPFS
jgi:hypothetical protein